MNSLHEDEIQPYQDVLLLEFQISNPPKREPQIFELNEHPELFKIKKFILI